jgi:hypothetical protein
MKATLAACLLIAAAAGAATYTLLMRVQPPTSR